VKKLLAASVAGLLLMAGVAAADSNSAVVRVGDRLGSSSATTNQGQGTAVTPFLIAGGAALIIIIIVAVGGNHSHSESP